MSTPDPLSPPPSSEQYLPQNTVGEQSFKPALTQSQWHAPSFSEELLQKRQDERQEELKKLAERPFPYHGNETEGCLFKTATIAAFSKYTLHLSLICSTKHTIQLTARPLYTMLYPSQEFLLHYVNHSYTFMLDVC
jgi:hypothetical protein